MLGEWRRAGLRPSEMNRRHNTTKIVALALYYLGASGMKDYESIKTTELGS